MITIGIKILHKKEVLDVQGRAILETLKRKNYSVEECHYGKYIKIKLEANNEKSALERAKEITESVLCNSLVESYELEVLSKSN